MQITKIDTTTKGGTRVMNNFSTDGFLFKAFLNKLKMVNFVCFFYFIMFENI